MSSQPPRLTGNRVQWGLAAICSTLSIAGRNCVKPFHSDHTAITLFFTQVAPLHNLPANEVSRQSYLSEWALSHLSGPVLCRQTPNTTGALPTPRLITVSL